MLVSTTTFSPSEGFVRHDFDVTGVRNALGFWLASRCCSDGHMCLVDPPTWAWNIGLPGLTHRVSFGAVIWHLGQWAHRFASPEMKIPGQRYVGRERIEEVDAIALGWDPNLIDELMRGDED